MANNEFRDIVRNVLKAKDSDYSGGKQFGNFEFVESAGYSRIDGVIIRLGDKIGRLVNMSDKAAVNESVIDTVIDGAGYSVVGLCLTDGVTVDEVLDSIESKASSDLYRVSSSAKISIYQATIATLVILYQMFRDSDDHSAIFLRMFECFEFLYKNLSKDNKSIYANLEWR